MIQRPQSVFLLAIISVLIMAMFADLNFYSTQDASAESEVIVSYKSTQINAVDGASEHQNTALFSLLAVSVLIALISIFSFKNRKLQASMVSFNFGAILGIMGLMYSFSFAKSYFPEGSDQIHLWVILPLFLLFFNYLALKGIRRDARIVRSMDRFR